MTACCRYCCSSGRTGTGLHDSTGLTAIAHALPLSPHLQELNLFGNSKITPVRTGCGPCLFAHRVSYPKRPLSLMYFVCIMMQVGCRVLCAAVKSSALTGLTLSIDLPPSLAEALRQALDANSEGQPALATGARLFGLQVLAATHHFSYLRPSVQRCRAETRGCSCLSAVEEATYTPIDTTSQAQAYLAMGSDGPPTR